VNHHLRMQRIRQRQNSFESLDKKALIQYARDKGINASSHWREETIINKIKEVENAPVR